MPRPWHALLVCCVLAASQAQAAPRAGANAAVLAVQELDRIEQRLASREQRLAALGEEVAQARRQRAYAASMRSLTAMRLARLEHKLRRRLGALARHCGQAQAPPLAGLASLAEVVQDEHRLRAIAAHDARLFADARRAHAVIDDQWRAQERAVASLQAALATQRQERSALAREHRRRQAIFARAQRTAPLVALAAARLRAAQSAIADSYAAGKADGQADPQPSLPADIRDETNNVPRLDWPVAGRLQARFGELVDLRFGTVTRHSGIAIAASHGTAVRSIMTGEVVFADWLSGFGRTIILAHQGEVHTVHAHLSKMCVKRGQHIARGGTLGEVGDTASLRGTRLYFEVRDHGRPVDPLGLLRPP